VARVFPSLDAKQRRTFVRECFATMGAHLGETVAHLRGPGDTAADHGMTPLPLAGGARAALEAARSEGHGIVFPSAHLGPWERVAASIVASGVPLVTLARDSYDPRFSELYARLRGVHGVRVVWRGSPGAATRIVRTLRRGEVLGTPMDLRARVPSCEAPFLGHDAPTAVGPAHIALRTGAAVVVGTAAPGAENPGSLVVTVTRIPTHDLPRGTRGVHELTARINAELSCRILALPHAWIWMHRRWG
jgi:KDO2-lipid IV(A) lauroyltransferase